jgi:hypothetical protein
MLSYDLIKDVPRSLALKEIFGPKFLSIFRFLMDSIHTHCPRFPYSITLIIIASQNYSMDTNFWDITCRINNMHIFDMSTIKLHFGIQEQCNQLSWLQAPAKEGPIFKNWNVVEFDFGK